MRLKLDENIPSSAATRLAALGHDVDTVLDENLGGHSDTEVWLAAQREERLLVTQDLDFSDERKFAAGTHAGILLVRLPDAEQWRVPDYLAAWFSEPEASTGAMLRRRHAHQGPRASPAVALNLATAAGSLVRGSAAMRGK